MLPASLTAAVEQSRRALLRAIGQTPDLTFLRGRGNLGDHLIWAGTRQLLHGVPHREIGESELSDKHVLRTTAPSFSISPRSGGRVAGR